MTTKTPQDHKTSKAAQDAEKLERFEDVEGHELLIPFSKVKGSDQARLTSRLQHVAGDAKPGDELDESDLDLDQVADLIDYVAEKFAVNTTKFEDFTRGVGGMSRAMNLVMAYVGELGKEEA